jgi:hypothetical protein
MPSMQVLCSPFQFTSLVVSCTSSTSDGIKVLTLALLLFSFFVRIIRHAYMCMYVFICLFCLLNPLLSRKFFYS